MSDQEIVNKLEQVWSSIADLCASFTEQKWKTPTDCPGWSVQDQVSHLVGSESVTFLGRAKPEHVAGDRAYVKNEIGASNEVLVDWRRSLPGAKVLEEFSEVTGERLPSLRAMSAGDFGAAAQTPIGPGTMRDWLNIRIFDAWIHEQDIRRAVGRSGHLEGPVAQHSIARAAQAMPFVVGKKAGAADGTTVVFDVTGPAGLSLAIGVDGSRANPLEVIPAEPDVHLSMDAETFACLGCGRWDPSDVLNSGKVTLSGDRTLGETIVRQMNFMI